MIFLRNVSLFCFERRLVAVDMRSSSLFSLRVWGSQMPSLLTFPIFFKWQQIVNWIFIFFFLTCLKQTHTIFRCPYFGDSDFFFKNQESMLSNYCTPSSTSRPSLFSSRNSLYWTIILWYFVLITWWNIFAIVLPENSSFLPIAPDSWLTFLWFQIWLVSVFVM